MSVRLGDLVRTGARTIRTLGSMDAFERNPERTSNPPGYRVDRITSRAIANYVSTATSVKFLRTVCQCSKRPIAKAPPKSSATTS